MSTEPASAEVTGTVTEVFDGDTVVVDTAAAKVTVRLIGINAPESGECHYTQSSDFLEDRVAGEVIRMNERGVDQFDRTLATLWVGDVNINQLMVSKGMAIASVSSDLEQPGELYLDDEESAYQDRIGLWSPDACGSGTSARVIIDGDLSTPDPPGPDDQVLDDETIVIVNATIDPVDLSGWAIRDESSRHRYLFKAGTIVPSSSRITVSSSDPAWDPGGSPVWNNDGDMALLLDQHGNVVGRWRY
ncbi:MAG: lamin tail domain-containing protein [Acidimicrobiia bacterium]